MSKVLPERIAGLRDVSDWNELRQKLVLGEKGAWLLAIENFFNERLKTRYLNPIARLQESGPFLGEGFSIVAIQCTLIEFLEATKIGKSYRRPTKMSPLNEHEYFVSSDLFISFLVENIPFSKIFDAKSAEDFYVNIRCALLHEARTRNGWRILADHESLIADIPNKILFRNNFQEALLKYIDSYCSELRDNVLLQRAFLRKFDSLCLP